MKKKRSNRIIEKNLEEKNETDTQEKITLQT